MGQPFRFAIADTAVAQAGGISLLDLHFDAAAICHAYDAVVPLAQRLGVPPPPPRLAGFAYSAVAALGAKITFPEDGEPNVVPMITDPADIDRLATPSDYLSAGVVAGRLSLLDELKSRRPDAVNTIGHLYEGPVTTAELLMGQSFLTLPFDDPERAHRLLDYCVATSAAYARSVMQRLGIAFRPGPVGIPDDFAGMFPPDTFADFVVPYWNGLYDAMNASERFLHSELLRVEHMPFLEPLRISVFDPSADQYLTPELLAEHCPCGFECRIQSWHVRDLSASDLCDMYRHLASFKPRIISFYLCDASEEPEISAILQTARSLQ
ncbi:MAG: hypothetical protein JW909_10190 [Planctomycetes bacterium]|nr:hypothetical protein [Planctomycetota bacterium]